MANTTTNAGKPRNSPKPLPLASSSTKASDAESDSLTSSGWPKPCAREPLDTVLIWDFYPSCFICLECFIQVYEYGPGEQGFEALEVLNSPWQLHYHRGLARLGHHTGKPHLVAAKVFQLTEWTYKLQFCAQEALFYEIRDVCMRCLEWSSSLFTSLEAGSGDMPIKLFVHAYFHFCVVIFFSPFHDAAVEDDTEINSQEICSQAAHATLGLSNSCDNLFTVQYASGISPYFMPISASFLRDDKDSRVANCLLQAPRVTAHSRKRS